MDYYSTESIKLMIDHSKQSLKLSRSTYLANEIVIVDGLPGCGKTMLSPILSSFDRVELISYAFEVEWICRLNYLKKIDKDAANFMVHNLIDHKIYQTMMGREVNFRYSDISSVFNYHNPIKYFKRIFQKGDMVIPSRIKKERPILNLTTHDLLSMIDPLVDVFGKNLFIVEVIRHPLFMVIQQALNMERLLFNERDMQVKIEYKNKDLPYYAFGWEEIFLKSNFVEKAILYIKYQTLLTEQKKKELNGKINHILIPFEMFVKDPNPFMLQIQDTINSRITRATKKEMRKQKVPRKNIVDSIPLQIYKRCGWEEPEKGLTEFEEFQKRRDFCINQGVSNKILGELDSLSHAYEQKFYSPKNN